MRVVEYSQILENEDNYILVDVRCPREYKNATIPGALNIALLSDQEYEIVGTLYKQEGRKIATLKAMEYVGPRLKELFLSFDKVFERNKEIAIFCARGGMRSSCVINFLSNFSFPIVKVNNGYKGYREYVRENLAHLFNQKSFLMLYGKTGVGKTELLKELKNRNYDILDIEGCANHRGSLLGSIGLSEPSSQKMFESYLFDSLRKSKSRVMICEGESRRIGNVMLAKYMYEKFINSPAVSVEATITTRVSNIKNDYLRSTVNNQEIVSALKMLERYVAKAKITMYIEEIYNNNYDFVIEELITKYYDNSYRILNTNIILSVNSDNIELCLDKIEQVYKNFLGNKGE